MSVSKKNELAHSAIIGSAMEDNGCPPERAGRYKHEETGTAL